MKGSSTAETRELDERNLNHGSTIDKFFCDAIMILRGAPIPEKDHGLLVIARELDTIHLLGEAHPRFAYHSNFHSKRYSRSMSNPPWSSSDLSGSKRPIVFGVRTTLYRFHAPRGSEEGMIVAEHLDDNAEKPASFRHALARGAKQEKGLPVFDPRPSGSKNPDKDQPGCPERVRRMSRFEPARKYFDLAKNRKLLCRQVPRDRLSRTSRRQTPVSKGNPAALLASQPFA